MNRFRMGLEKSGKIVTERDWMIAALLALTKQSDQELLVPLEASTAIESKPSVVEVVEEDMKDEAKDEAKVEEGKEAKVSTPTDVEKGQKEEGQVENT